MKKNLSVLIILMAFAAVLFMGCANGSNDTNNSSGGGSSTTAVSGKSFQGTFGGASTIIAFADSGNTVNITDRTNIDARTGTYTMSGNAITIKVSGNTLTFTYNSTAGTITGEGYTLTQI